MPTFSPVTNIVNFVAAAKGGVKVLPPSRDHLRMGDIQSPYGFVACSSEGREVGVTEREVGLE